MVIISIPTNVFKLLHFSSTGKSASTANMIGQLQLFVNTDTILFTTLADKTFTVRNIWQCKQAKRLNSSNRQNLLTALTPPSLHPKDPSPTSKYFHPATNDKIPRHGSHNMDRRGVFHVLRIHETRRAHQQVGIQGRRNSWRVDSSYALEDQGWKGRGEIETSACWGGEGGGFG